MKKNRCTPQSLAAKMGRATNSSLDSLTLLKAQNQRLQHENEELRAACTILGACTAAWLIVFIGILG
jgi:hypothetical protein